MKRDNVITETRDIKIEIRNGNLADITNFIQKTGLCDVWNHQTFSFRNVLKLLGNS